MITRQAQIIAYIDDFKLLMIATLVVIPLLIVFKKASNGSEDHTLRSNDSCVCLPCLLLFCIGRVSAPLFSP